MVHVPEGAVCTGWSNAHCEGDPACPPRCPRFFDSEGDPVLVRLLANEHRDSLVDMYDRLDPEHQTMGVPPRTRAGIEDWLDTLVAAGWNLVALADDRVVGHVGVAPADAAAPTFVVFVDADYQGRGVGTELIRQAVAYAADRDHDELELSVSVHNERAIDVYEHVGFEVDADDAGAGVVCVDMHLPLSSSIADYVRLPPAER